MTSYDQVIALREIGAALQRIATAMEEQTQAMKANQTERTNLISELRKPITPKVVGKPHVFDDVLKEGG